MDTLTGWLARELKERAWSVRELARRAGISHTQVNLVLGGQAVVTADFCLAVARALRAEPEAVLRLGGFLPPLPPAVAEEQEVVRVLRGLAPPIRRAVATMVLALGRAAAETEDDRLVRELVDEFRQVPDEWQDVALREMERVRGYATRAPVRIIGDKEPGDDIAQTEKRAEDQAQDEEQAA